MESIINLEKWLTIKLDHYDGIGQNEITTNDVRKWINLYNDLIEKGFQITQNYNNENR